jgi:hypothetical protein
MTRSRGIKLPVDQQCNAQQSAQLIVDIAARNNYHFKDLLALRPKLYGGVSKVACSNRCAYTKRLLKEDPSKFWSDHAKKLNCAPGPTLDYLESKLHKQEDDDDDDDDEEEEEEEIATNTNFYPQMPTANREKGTPQKGSIPEYVSPSASSTASTGQTASCGRASRVHGTPMKGRELFSTLQEAKLSAIHHHIVDFAYPEHYGPTFFVQLTDQVKTKNHKELYEEVKIWVNDVTDLRDYENYYAHVVCQGRAILVTIPSIPYFRRDKKEIKILFGLEAVRCTNSENTYTTAVNAIIKDPSRYLSTHLFELPGDMVVTSNLQSDIPPRGDEKAEFRLRQFSSTAKVGKKTSKYQTKEFTPGYWRFRVIADDKLVLSDDEEEEEPDLEDMFKGMKVNSKPDRDGTDEEEMDY